MMNHRARVLICTLIAGLSPNALLAQQVNCGDALRYAGESWNQKSENDHVHAVVDLFCSRKLESKEAAVKTGGAVNIPIEGIPWDMKGDLSGTEIQIRQEEFCSDSRKYERATSLLATQSKVLNAAVAKGVGECIALQAQQSGLFAWIEQNVDPNVFKVRVALRGIAGPIPIRDFGTLPTVKCTKSLNGSLAIGDETLCTRDPRHPITVTFSSDKVIPTWVGSSSLPSVPDWTTKFRTCGERDRCEGGVVVACQVAEAKFGEIDRKISPNFWLYGPNSDEYRSGTTEAITHAIEFGAWENSQCGLKDQSGWHARVGSCQQGGGTGWQRCANVRVRMP